MQLAGKCTHFVNGLEIRSVSMTSNCFEDKRVEDRLDVAWLESLLDEDGRLLDGTSRAAPIGLRKGRVDDCCASSSTSMAGNIPVLLDVFRLLPVSDNVSVSCRGRFRDVAKGSGIWEATGTGGTLFGTGGPSSTSDVSSSIILLIGRGRRLRASLATSNNCQNNL